jgi:hypothetical protein
MRARGRRGTGTTAGTIATLQIDAPYMGLYGGTDVDVTAGQQWSSGHSNDTVDGAADRRKALSGGW